MTEGPGDGGEAAEEAKVEEVPNKPEAAEEDVDPYEFYPEADILSKFDGEW